MNVVLRISSLHTYDFRFIHGPDHSIYTIPSIHETDPRIYECTNVCLYVFVNSVRMGTQMLQYTRMYMYTCTVGFKKDFQNSRRVALTDSNEFLYVEIVFLNMVRGF